MKWILLMLVVIKISTQERPYPILGTSILQVPPCKSNPNVSAIFEGELAPEEENQYTLNIIYDIKPYYVINLRFDSDATLTLADPKVARITARPKSDVFNVKFYKEASNLEVKVKGPTFGTVPYVKNIYVNDQEICTKPRFGYFDEYIQGVKDTAEISSITRIPDDSCGRRKIVHTELIVKGEQTNPGDWPWHVALFRVEGSFLKYICGGSLLSKSLILTAAHCATIRGVPVVPESLNVVLGKHNLVGGDLAPQEREVLQVIVYPSFNATILDNDIALLKLKSEAVFDDYVQPICLWDRNSYKKLRKRRIYGTVVGWGFDHNDLLSPTLQQITIPKVSDATCLKSNAVFFTKTLNSNKFCAGYTNGTSACNGDSGGGFHVFVPETAGDNSFDAGSWHVRGIVSMTMKRNDAAICDPNYYVLFTDVKKYRDWILGYLDA